MPCNCKNKNKQITSNSVSKSTTSKSISTNKYNQRFINQRKIISTSKYNQRFINQRNAKKVFISTQKYGKPHLNATQPRTINKTVNRTINKTVNRTINKTIIKQTNNDLRSWDKIHKMSVNINGLEDVIEFKKYMEFLAKKFPCPKCRPHIKARLIKKPILKAYQNNKEEGLAKWSWKFHNKTNKRLNKTKISWEQFSSIYLK